MSWDNVGPNQCHMDGTPIRRTYTKPSKEQKMTEKIEFDDFGFTLVGEDDIAGPADNRAEKLRDMIMPLLKNLKKNPEKDYIQWPGKDRVKKIDEFITKMNSVVDGH